MDIELFRSVIAAMNTTESAIDVGANRGEYAIMLSKYFDRVTAFEPDSATFLALENQIRVSCATGVTPVNAAASDRDGHITFYRDLRPEWGGVAGSVHVLDGLEGRTEEIRVPCVSLDSYCAAHDITPSFIKIDVEGHEPAVIEGARQIISRHRPVLVFEFWETWFHRDYRETFVALDSLYELSVLQTGDLVRDRYLATDGKPGGEAGVVDILCRPRGTGRTHRRVQQVLRWLGRHDLTRLFPRARSARTTPSRPSSLSIPFAHFPEKPRASETVPSSLDGSREKG